MLTEGADSHDAPVYDETGNRSLVLFDNGDEVTGDARKDIGKEQDVHRKRARGDRRHAGGEYGAELRAGHLSQIRADRRGRLDADEYVALRDSIGDLRAEMDSQDETFELLPFAESLVQECGLTENVLSMKPMMRQALQLETNYHETIVEIEMEKLTLGQLFDFLWKIKSSDVLANTKRLYIKKNSTDAGLLDSTVEISNLKLSQS